jgi:hypothetical protein
MTDELFNPDEFLATFPMWFLAHPTKPSEGFIAVTGPQGEKAVPLFTDKDLAEQFRGSAVELCHYALAIIPDPAMLVMVLGIIERAGFTHVTIDQDRGRAACYPIGQLRSFAEQADGSPDGPTATGEGA